MVSRLYVAIKTSSGYVTVIETKIVIVMFLSYFVKTMFVKIYHILSSYLYLISFIYHVM